MVDYQKHDPALYKAPSGKYRVIDIDMWVVDGFSGQPDEEAGIMIGDYRLLWIAKIVANWTTTGRFYRQVHDSTGACVYDSLVSDYPWIARMAKYTFSLRNKFARIRYKVRSIFSKQEDCEW